LLDEDAAVLHDFRRVGDFDQLAHGLVGISDGRSAVVFMPQPKLCCTTDSASGTVCRGLSRPSPDAFDQRPSLDVFVARHVSYQGTIHF
jgi:hypothetical protein